MDDAVEVLPYSLLQGGCGIRKRAAYHPPPQRDLMFVFDHNGGTKHRTYMDRGLDLVIQTGTVQPAEIAVESLIMQRF